MEVLFCRQNLQAVGRDALEELVRKAGSRLRVQEVKCIIACSECATQYIARVNGELVVADTAQTLASEILRLADLAEDQ